MKEVFVLLTVVDEEVVGFLAQINIANAGHQEASDGVLQKLVRRRAFTHDEKGREEKIIADSPNTTQTLAGSSRPSSYI